MTTETTTSPGVWGILMYINPEIADNARTITTAPDSRIGLRPHLSTRYHLKEILALLDWILNCCEHYGGMVLITYTIPFIPVIKMASRPIHPACSNTSGAFNLSTYGPRSGDKETYIIGDDVDSV